MGSAQRPVRVVALIKGGLGNQLFIYITARQVIADLAARGIPAELHLDTSFYLHDPRYGNFFEIDRLGLPYHSKSGHWPGWVRQKLIRVWETYGRSARAGTLGIFPETEPTGFTPIHPRPGARSIVISGYRQHVGYFDGGSALRDIKAELDARAPAPPDAPIADGDVCLHLRVLYTTTGNTFNADRWTPRIKDYYVRGVAAVAADRPVDTCWVFGDHADTQHDLVARLEAAGFRARAWVSGFQDDAVADFQTMRRFRRFVIADSTFAWWSAYLASRLESVALPEDVYRARPGQIFAACRLL